MLIALTSPLVPLEIRAFGQDLGWQLTFPFGLYVHVPGVMLGVRGQFRTPVKEFGLISKYDIGGQIGVAGWILTALVVFVTAGYVFTLEWDDEWTQRRMQSAAAGFGAAGLLFLVTRIPMYEFVFVSSSEMPNWFTVPFGAVYLVFVGAVFVRWSRDVGDPGEGNG